MKQYPYTTLVEPSLPDRRAKRVPLRLLTVAILAALSIPTAYVLHQHNLARAEAQAQLAAAAAAQETSLFDGIAITGAAAYVFDVTTGRVLYEKDAHVQLPLASVTKLMLALAVTEVLSFDESISITAAALATEGDSELMLGERWNLQDLIDFTLIESSNDGAAALAEAAAPRIRAQHFGIPANADPAVWRMNRLADEFELSQTYFLNPTGLDESERMAGAYGSARDIAHLMAYAILRHPEAVAGTARGGLLLTSTNGTREAENTNEILGSIPGLIAGKTGFTDLAGGNLVVAFDAGLGRPIVAVVLGSTEEGRFVDMQRLISAAREDIVAE